MAIVRGTSTQVSSAIKVGIGSKFYPDEELIYASAESNRTIDVETVHALGFTGEGMQIALVDTGIDATHPDLADHVIHNIKLVRADMLDVVPGSDLVVPVEAGPNSNTDDSGHGTMVAGVLAADGTTDPSQVGVAPDAELIGYGVGAPAANFMTSAIVAYDHILAHPEFGIDVVNNSWGSSSFRLFDPSHPINIATKVLTDSGMSVVWSAGNGGTIGDAEMTLNPYAQAPWNITVSGTDQQGMRWTGASSGLMIDNSVPVSAGEDHVRFTGDGLGMYHPTISAPASQIATSCGLVNLYTNCVPGETATVDGTSVAAPHVSGLVSLLLQARPGLTISQVKEVLEASAKPTMDQAPFWQVGYGLVDGAAALDLVLSKNFKHKLQKAHEDANERLLAARDWTVSASDLWSWQPPTAEAGVAGSREFTVHVPAGTEAVKVALAYETNNGASGFSATVKDAAGVVVGASTPSAYPGVSTVLFDLRDTAPAFGEWILQVDEILPLVSMDEPANETGRVTIQAAVLEAQDAVAVPHEGFVAERVQELAFIPEQERATGFQSPEGCEMEGAEPVGGLSPSRSDGPCHSALTGWALTYMVRPAEFTSQPLDRSVVIGGDLGLVAYFSDPSRPVGAVAGGRVEYSLEELTAEGDVHTLGAGTILAGQPEGRNVGIVKLSPATVAAGSRLRFHLIHPGGYSSAARLLFGGEAYGDSGITLTVGHMQ
jgi:serine protease AprX